LYVGIITDQNGRPLLTAKTPSAGGVTLRAECGIFDDIYNRIIVGLRGVTKCRKRYGDGR
jgi:hypothetical protein